MLDPLQAVRPEAVSGPSLWSWSGISCSSWAPPSSCVFPTCSFELLVDAFAALSFRPPPLSFTFPCLPLSVLQLGFNLISIVTFGLPGWPLSASVLWCRLLRPSCPGFCFNYFSSLPWCLLHCSLLEPLVSSPSSTFTHSCFILLAC